MTTKATIPEVDEQKPTVPAPKMVVPTGMDEFAVSVLIAMGYKDIPESVSTMYREFKRRKDLVQPGRLSPEGFATVALLADLYDQKINVKKG